MELRLAEAEVLGRMEGLARQRVLGRGLIELLQVSGLALLQALALASLAEAPGGPGRAPSLLAALALRLQGARRPRRSARRHADTRRYVETLAASQPSDPPEPPP